MSDLISRAAAIGCLGNSPEQMCMPWSEMERMLRELPAVDAAPVVHGRWIDYKDEHQCSVCKETTIVDFYVWRAIQFDFCPYCGAKMDGERRDADEG